VYPGTHARRTPDRPAVVLAGTGQVITYRRLDERSNALAHFLRRAGLVHGDVVAVLTDRNTHFHEVAWAARRSGLVAVAVNPFLDASDIAHVVRDSGARVLVCDAGLTPLTRPLTPATAPLLTHRLVTGGAAAGFTRYEDALAGLPVHPVDGETEGDLLTYSSGTTGRPKGVRERVGGGPISADRDPYVPRGPLAELGQDTVLLAPGLHHGGPRYLSMGVHRIGGTVVVPEARPDGFDAAGTLAAIERHGVTHALMSPHMLARLLKLPASVRAAHSTASLRQVLLSFAPCPEHVMRGIIEWWGPVVTHLWGFSERGGGAMITSPEWLDHPGSVGRPLGGTAHILDDAGNELPPGALGRICFSDPADRAELHNLPGTTSVCNDLGWIDSGDVGRLDADGYLYHVDRRASRIVVDGTEVYPQPVEDVLIQHPDVLDAAVHGVTDPVRGARLRAVVQLTATARPMTAAELLAWCRERLDPVHRPELVAFGRVPRSDTGKLYRRYLEARYRPAEADGPAARAAAVPVGAGA
jgi:fatty-acyl-CoA synthase